MNIIDSVNEFWGWVGLSAVEVLGENDFGSLIIKDQDGTYWRLCPDALSCAKVAANRDELDALAHSQAFLQDWYRTDLVDLAEKTLGTLGAGRKYCLKTPAMLGGHYAGANLATVPLLELIRFSGDVAQDIDSMPDRNYHACKFAD